MIDIGTIILHSFSVVGFTLFFYMTAWFIVSLILKRNDVADVAWGIGFIVAALVPQYTDHFALDRALFVTLLVIIWGGRLSLHIYNRNKGKPEDKRYAQWRADWGEWVVVRSYLQVFILQGIFLLFIVSPVVLITTVHGSHELSVYDVLGTIIWTIGFYFESTGDKQLRQFLSKPENKGKVLNTGLWKYSRHPNYFGEVTQWWGLWIIAFGLPYGVWTIIGPLTISFLILKVSGVPLLEKNMAQNSVYDEYRKTTSEFIPWPPHEMKQTPETSQAPQLNQIEQSDQMSQSDKLQ